MQINIWPGILPAPASSPVKYWWKPLFGRWNIADFTMTYHRQHLYHQREIFDVSPHFFAFTSSRFRHFSFTAYCILRISINTVPTQQSKFWTKNVVVVLGGEASGPTLPRLNLLRAITGTDETFAYFAIFLLLISVQPPAVNSARALNGGFLCTYMAQGRTRTAVERYANQFCFTLMRATQTVFMSFDPRTHSTALPDLVSANRGARQREFGRRRTRNKKKTCLIKNPY